MDALCGDLVAQVDDLTATETDDEGTERRIGAVRQHVDAWGTEVMKNVATFARTQSAES